jgi:hypothetical protein
MLMLTHTCMLQDTIRAAGIRDIEPDIYIYNIAPDLLTIHPDISAGLTHSIDRFIEAPADHKKTAYVMYHLLVDDIAHYGEISLKCAEGFNPDSGGYTYIKGKNLVGRIIELYKLIGREISRGEAAYRSHLIIEMIYDLVISTQIHKNQSIRLLADAINFTLDKKAEQFCSDMSWLYSIEQNQALYVLKSAVTYITEERMERFMNLEGRIRLFTDKFGLRNDNLQFAESIQTLFRDALNCVENDDFFHQAAAAIDDCGWAPSN